MTDPKFPERPGLDPDEPSRKVEDWERQFEEDNDGKL